MTSTEIELGEDLERLEHLDFDIEVPCEVPERAKIGKPGGTPKCDGRPARWVGWRSNCCPESPNYILLCDECKRTYQAWQAASSIMYCANCGRDNGGFISFTELNRKS